MAAALEIAFLLLLILLLFLLLLLRLLGGWRLALRLVRAPVGALAVQATVTQPFAPVACLEPAPLAVQVGAVGPQLQVLGQLRVRMRSCEFRGRHR